jgi:hypothetical protein
MVSAAISDGDVRPSSDRTNDEVPSALGLWKLPVLCVSELLVGDSIRLPEVRGTAWWADEKSRCINTDDDRRAARSGRGGGVGRWFGVDGDDDDDDDEAGVGDADGDDNDARR